jgi:hypothetical protein
LGADGDGPRRLARGDHLEDVEVVEGAALAGEVAVAAERVGEVEEVRDAVRAGVDDLLHPRRAAIGERHVDVEPGDELVEGRIGGARHPGGEAVRAGAEVDRNAAVDLHRPGLGGGVHERRVEAGLHRAARVGARGARCAAATGNGCERCTESKTSSRQVHAIDPFLERDG